jgi:hypothetical protein
VQADCTRLASIPDAPSVLFDEMTREWTKERKLATMIDGIDRLWGDKGVPKSGDKPEEHLPLSLFWVPSERLNELRRRARSGEFSVDKRILRRAVQAELEPVFGKGVSLGPLRFVTQVASCTLVTEIDFKPRSPAQLALIGHHTTQWSFFVDQDIPRVAANIREFCELIHSHMDDIFALAGR